MKTRRITFARGRRAFTLFELLLAMALLVVLASLSWPSLSQPLAMQRLRSATDEVRTAWAQARTAAMSTGCTYIFRYALKGDRYAVECHVAPESTVDVSPIEIAAVEAETAEIAEPGNAGQGPRLPQGICFIGGVTAVDSRAQLTAATEESAADAELMQTDPIYFYPDGTTSTARLRLQNEFGWTMELSLRGLTGVASVELIKDEPQ